jgi:hypothetical protein
MIAVASIMQNNMPSIERYLAQLKDLRQIHDIRVTVGYGDSDDGTANVLENIPPDQIENILEVNHHGPRFGSVDSPLRWSQIASVVRPTLAVALEENPDVLVWVEADLIWDTVAMSQLIERCEGANRTIAPMVFGRGEDRFYDHWGFRMNGRHFTEYMPYFPENPWPDNSRPPDGLAKIDSCGSCFVTRDFDALRRWDGRWPYTAEGLLWVDPMIAVEHP